MPSLPKNAFEMTEPYYDRKDQHDRFEALLVPGETLWMTLDCKGSGTGFVGITDKRLIFQDANWRKTRNVIVSVPLDRVVQGPREDADRLPAPHVGVSAAAWLPSISRRRRPACSASRPARTTGPSILRPLARNQHARHRRRPLPMKL